MLNAAASEMAGMPQIRTLTTCEAPALVPPCAARREQSRPACEQHVQACEGLTGTVRGGLEETAEETTYNTVRGGLEETTMRQAGLLVLLGALGCAGAGVETGPRAGAAELATLRLRGGTGQVLILC